MTISPIAELDAKLAAQEKPAVETPDADMSLYVWLHKYAEVKVGKGFQRYSLAGREPLYTAILILDYVLGNDCSYADDVTRLSVLGTTQFGKLIPDAYVEICGGAQFGKTILALLLKTYLGTVKFRGCMYCLPDDDLVQGIIDTKERPEVIDRIPYVGRMLQEGTDNTASGKAVNRKGAMLYTNGVRSAVSMMRGLGKFPTSFTCDCVIVDERDDVRAEYADYLPGRMTTSDLRLMINIGTQRYHGAGQNALFLEGSQHVGHLTCSQCGRLHNPEEDWPGICRMSVTGVKSPTDPRLDNSGRFCRGEEPVARYHPDFDYYFACVNCGAELDRTHIEYTARAAEQIAARHWSVRVSQMCCSALPVAMFASDWCTQAVKKANKRTAFNCDRLAIPKSSGQKLSPQILERAMRATPYRMQLAPGSAPHRYAGIDTGDQCYFVARDADGAQRRLAWTESMADSETRARAVALFATLRLDCLFIDAGPLRDLSRDLALTINNLRSVDIRSIPEWAKKRILFPGGVEWNGERGEWKGVRCAPVEFSAKPGAGISQAARLTPDGMHIYPVISCNRDEAIQGVIDDLLTAEDGYAVVDPKSGALRTMPAFLLPERDPERQSVVDVYCKHLLAGSCKLRDADGKEEHFIDKIENHYLLATVYARLAEQFSGADRVMVPFRFERVGDEHPDNAEKGVLL